MKRTSPPVSSFAPELLELYLTAFSIGEVTIALANKKQALNLRFRLHQLRQAMRDEGHSQATLANGVQFNITELGDLIAKRSDAPHLAAIRLALGPLAPIDAPIVITFPADVAAAQAHEPIVLPDKATETLKDFLTFTPAVSTVEPEKKE